MHEPLAYVNGRFVPASQIGIPVWDAGFVQGTAVAEQLRTFGGRLFQLDEHLARLRHSLEIVEVDPGVELSELGRLAEQLAAENHRLLDPRDDLGLSMVVTPGPYAAFAPADATGPLVCMHTYPLPFRLWADRYQQGERLIVTSVEQVPPRCWPPELKCRSRMHYHLAERQARRIDPSARALLVDADGLVCETPTANVLAWFEGQALVSPRRDKILPGISMGVVERLAAECGIGVAERDLRPSDLAAADEILLTSTSPCVLPVVRLNETAIGNGRPGPLFTRLLAAWGERVGIDLAAQAARFAARA
jgi:branched-chain amino acid aminotransferase